MTSPNRTISVHPDQLRAFAQEYKPLAEKWDNIARNLQKILDSFDEEASKYTRSKSPMPVTMETRKILVDHLSGVMEACKDFSRAISSDADGLAFLATAFEENEQAALAALKADTVDFGKGFKN